MTDETDWREKYVQARVDVHMRDTEIQMLKGELLIVTRKRDNWSAVAIGLGAGLLFLIAAMVFG